MSEKHTVALLAEKINALAPAALLRLAAELLERGQLDLAGSIVERISIELGALRLLRRTK